MKQAVVRLDGFATLLTYHLDSAEVSRRRRGGMGALPDLALLDILLGLPAGLPVSRDDLTDRERRALRHAPPGAVEHGHGQVVRQAIAPLSVDSVLVTARDWRVGLRRAGSFAPYCRRALRLATCPDDIDEALAQARFYGIGLLVGHPHCLRELSAPAPYSRQRHSAAQWQFAELVYANVLAVQADPNTAGAVT